MVCKRQIVRGLPTGKKCFFDLGPPPCGLKEFIVRLVTVSKVLPARVRLIGSVSHKFVLDASLCCFYFRSQPGRFRYCVGNVSDWACEFKGRHNVVCQILTCLVEVCSSGEINILISVLVHLGL